MTATYWEMVTITVQSHNEYKERCPPGVVQRTSCRPVYFQNLNQAVEVKTSKKEEEAWLFVLEFWKQSAARLKWNLGREGGGSSGRGSRG